MCEEQNHRVLVKIKIIHLLKLDEKGEAFGSIFGPCCIITVFFTLKIITEKNRLQKIGTFTHQVLV